MKKLPPKFSLLVFGSKIPVVLTKNLALHAGALGQYNYMEKSIQLEADQDKEEMWRSLLHEACHSMCHRVGLNQAMSREMEEILCEGVANLIFENFNISLK